jgi:hypothetical protein
MSKLPSTSVLEAPPAQGKPDSRIRFDRNELAGAFGDIGTDLPLIVGMTLAAGLDSASVLTMFGLMQIGTGLLYRLPMPVQPLKAMAALVIAQQIEGRILYGAGLAVGAAMLLLTATRAIDWLARVVPKSVVRGIQFGLGLQLASIALGDYMRADGVPGYLLAGAGFVITVFLLGNRRYPPALFVMTLGIVYAFVFKIGPQVVVESAGFHLPTVHAPAWQAITTGFVLLALPQIPLSLGNSLLATRQIVSDLFPASKLTVRKIAWTYSLMNLVNPFFGGIPTCHGSGGIAGHFAFGGRTGGSVVIYGSLYVALGLFFSSGFSEVIQVFPLPILGVLLFFEGLALVRLIRDLADSASDFIVALLVGMMALLLPYGYVVALVLGTALAYLSRRGSIALAKVGH